MLKPRPIYKKLLQSYILFAVIAIAVTLSGALVVLRIATNGGSYSLLPEQIIGYDGRIQSKDALLRMGGWIEELDDDYRVISVTGKKLTARQHYRTQDLINMVGTSNADKDYSIFYENKGDHRYMIFIPNALNVIYTEDGTKISPGTSLSIIIPIFLVVLIIEALFFSRYIYRWIQYPLKELTDAAQKTQAGARNAELDFDAEGEFIILRDATNDMIRTIAEQEDENRKLVEAQKRLILELSHDLQTPITTIGACASALEDGVVEEQDKDRYYQIIQTKANRVSSLTEDMLTLLKMEDAEYKPLFERLDICEEMRLITSEYYSDMQLGHFEPVIEIPETPVYVSADDKLLRRAVGNLLSNAIKYNKTGKSIRVTVTGHIKSVSINIADDGVPIKPEVRNVMFDAFARDDEARKTTGGTGLGLTIAREITEHHGGTMSYHYEDGWNIMTMRLPVVQDD